MELIFDGKKYSTRFKPGIRVRINSLDRMGHGLVGVVNQIGYDQDIEAMRYKVIFDDPENVGWGIFGAIELEVIDSP
jgi:hypothetical protein